MARQRKVSAADLGLLLGEALGEGLAVGLGRAVKEAQAELQPVADELLAMLRKELEAATALAPAEDETILLAGARGCEAPGCERRAIARGLCRRHYARTVYQERKAREGGEEGVIALRRRVRPAVDEGGDAVDKKVVVPVAPIVRRKKSEGDEPVNAPAAARAAAASPAPAPSPAVTAESIARLWGLSK